MPPPVSGAKVARIVFRPSGRRKAKRKAWRSATRQKRKAALTLDGKLRTRALPEVALVLDEMLSSHAVGSVRCGSCSGSWRLSSWATTRMHRRGGCAPEPAQWLRRPARPSPPPSSPAPTARPDMDRLPARRRPPCPPRVLSASSAALPIGSFRPEVSDRKWASADGGIRRWRIRALGPPQDRE